MIKERFIIGRSVGSEYGVGEAPFFVVPIDHTLARLIVEMIDKFAEGCPYHGLAFAEMWSADARFMSTLKYVLPEGGLDDTGTDLFPSFGDVACFAREELLCNPNYIDTIAGLVHTEADLMRVSRFGVSWFGYIDGTDSYVETAQLSRDQIVAIMNDTRGPAADPSLPQ